MDLRVYYQKLRKIEAELTEPFVVIVSRATQDGGKAGVKTDVPRSVAAKMLTEERADLASPEESAQFRGDVEREWKAAQPTAEIPGEEPKPARSIPKAGKKK
jgi:hypothetical protein